MKRRLSFFTFMMVIASFLLSINLSTVYGAPAGLKVVPDAAPCIGLYANDASTPGYKDTVVTFNEDGSMSFDFAKGYDGKRFGFQPGSKYIWDQLFYIENLKSEPLKYQITNVGLNYISVEDYRTNLSFVSDATNNDVWETIGVGETTSIRVFFEIPPNALLTSEQEEISGTLNIITDCTGGENGNGNGNGTTNGGTQENPAIQLEKKADVSLAKPGDAVTYTYIVRNTGNQTLYNIVLHDSVLGDIPLDKTTLKPGEEAIGTIRYTVTNDDFPGPLENKAVVIGYTESSKVESFDEASVILFQDRAPDEPKKSDPSRGNNGANDPSLPELPKTGGAAFPYIAGGFVLAGIGVLLKRKS